MRERPSFRLAEVSSLGKVIPSSYNLVATDTAIEGRVLGNVYKDPTAIKTRMVWASVVRGEGGESIYIGHHGTRQKAASEVAENWVLFQDESEAHGIVEVMDQSAILAVEHAQQQRDDWGDDSHLATELNAKHVLDEPTEQLTARLISLRKELSDVLNGKGSWKLELAHIERLAYDAHMIDLELERRERQVRLQRSASKVELMRESDEPVFCAECRLHINLHPSLANPESENTDEDCCGRYQHQLTLMPSMPMGYNSWGTWRAVYFREKTRSERSKRVLNSVMARQLSEDLVQPTDGMLVRSIHEHLTSPWRPTPAVMRGMLDAVRELEKRALEAEKVRPASMVVTVQDDVLERLTKLERQHKVLKARTTMLLAGVVTALDDDEKAMLKLLTRTFAMGPDDITDEDPEVDEALQEAVIEDLYDQLATVSCDCPRGDDDVHEIDCVNHPDYLQHKDVQDEWRTNPYSLPPATREGVECPACSGPTGQTFNGVRMLREVRHEDQATVDECVRRQRLMGWKPLEGESGCGHP